MSVHELKAKCAMKVVCDITKSLSVEAPSRDDTDDGLDLESADQNRSVRTVNVDVAIKSLWHLDGYVP